MLPETIRGIPLKVINSRIKNGQCPFVADKPCSDCWWGLSFINLIGERTLVTLPGNSDATAAEKADLAVKVFSAIFRSMSEAINIPEEHCNNGAQLPPLATRLPA